jgi:hypothetical protein
MIWAEILDMDVNTWTRVSICAGKGTTVDLIRHINSNYGNDLISQGFPSGYEGANRTVYFTETIFRLSASPFVIFPN